MSSNDRGKVNPGRKKAWGILAIAVLVLVLLAGALASGMISLGSSPPCTLTRRATIALPGLVGRIDHMSFDAKGGLLYVAAYGNNTLDVVNATSGRLDRTVSGFNEPQGVLYLGAENEVYVSNGGTGTVDVLDAGTLHSVANISLGSDADNIRYDPFGDLVYVGFGEGGIAVVDPHTRSIVKTIPLPGHPEAFEIDNATGSVYVNVPTSGYIATISLATGAVTDRLPLTNSTGNFPMALDVPNQRLIIGTRSPSEMQVFDATSGTPVAAVTIPQDPDDIFYGASGCIFVSSGSGYVTVLKESSPADFKAVGQVTTSTGARTSLLVGSAGLYFVAAPSTGPNGASIIEFAVS